MRYGILNVVCPVVVRFNVSVTDTWTVGFVRQLYECGIVVVPVRPPRLDELLSPKLTTTLEMPIPAGAVTWICRFTVACPEQVLGSVGVMMIVGEIAVMTLTTVLVFVVLPAASVADTFTTYVFASTKVCDTTAFPVTVPNSVDEPSPQSTVTALMALPFVAPGFTAIVKLAGTPALGGVAGGVITIVGAPAILTVTLPDAWPDADGVVGVVPPPVPVPGVVGVVGVVVLLPTPTFAVTVAVCAVVSVVVAMPPPVVLATPTLSVPAVVVNVTGMSFIKLPLASNTVAEIVVEPPSAGTVAGVALTTTR